MKTPVMILAASTVLAACAAEEQAAETVQTVGQWRIEVNRPPVPGASRSATSSTRPRRCRWASRPRRRRLRGILIFVQGYEGIEPGQSIPGDLHRRRPAVQGHLHRPADRRVRRRHRPGGQRRLHLQPRRPGLAHHRLRRRPSGDRPARGRRPRHRCPARLPGTPVARRRRGCAAPGRWRWSCAPIFRRPRRSPGRGPRRGSWHGS